jgi:hypothetical protein
MSLVYKDDVGARIIVNSANLTLPATATLSLLVKKPSGLTATWTMVFDFVAGTGVHTTVAGDVDESGEYQVQIHAVFLTGEILDSNIDSFYVYDRVY